MKLRRLSPAAVLAASALFVGAVALAASTIIVTPTNTQGWSTADTRPGGTVAIVQDSTAPSGGNGSLHLTTNNTTAAKAQYMHATQTPLADVDNLSYQTKQVAANVPEGAPSYQVAVCLNGVDVNGTCSTTNNFTTLVYEPYWNGSVTNGVWQSWEVDAGQFWSSKSVTCSGGSLVAGGGGPPLYTLDQVKTVCPAAVVVGFGVNVGTYNPSYDVYADLVTFNDETYDFEFYSVPSDKAQCKNNGWATFNPNRPAGPFKNQGDCVQYFNTGK